MVKYIISLYGNLKGWILLKWENNFYLRKSIAVENMLPDYCDWDTLSLAIYQ